MNLDNKPVSGTADAGSANTDLGTSGQLYAGVWVSVPSDASAEVEVIADGDTAGPRVGVGETQFFPAVRLDHVKVKRTGGSDQTVYFWAF